MAPSSAGSDAYPRRCETPYRPENLVNLRVQYSRGSSFFMLLDNTGMETSEMLDMLWCNDFI